MKILTLCAMFKASLVEFSVTFVHMLNSTSSERMYGF